MKKIVFPVLLLLLLNNFVAAQSGDLLPRVSPNASISQSVGYTAISINYCRPGVRGRKVWGDLVPYNKVWRTGANEATTIQFSTDVFINKTKVPAGRYSLFTIPGEKEWIVIINKTDKQWGAFRYKVEDDFLRFTVNPTKSSFNELLQFSFSDVTESVADININWENLQVTFKVEVDLVSSFVASMKEKLSTKPDDFQVYSKCAEFAADHNFLLSDALAWADKAISIEPTAYFPYFAKAKVLFKNNKSNEALQLIEKCREVGRNDKSYDVSVVDLFEKQVKNKIGK